jgi:hypothetical protein
VSDRTVGVDAEPLARGIDPAFYRRVLTPEEAEWLRAEPGRQFSWLWTRKESVMKACGLGLTLSPSGFSVLGSSVTLGEDVYTLHSSVISGHAAATAALRPEPFAHTPSRCRRCWDHVRRIRHMANGQVCLRRGEDSAVRAGACWIFDNEIDWADDVCRDGDVVDVLDSRMRFLARGFFNARSHITVRVLTLDERPRRSTASFSAAASRPRGSSAAASGFPTPAASSSARRTACPA